MVIFDTSGKIFRNHQGQKTNCFTLIFQFCEYGISIHFIASTSLILPKHLSVVDKFECRNMTFETISMGTPERLA